MTRAEKSPEASLRAASASSRTGLVTVLEAATASKATKATAPARNRPIWPARPEAEAMTRASACRALATTTSRGAASTTASRFLATGAKASSVSSPR